MKRACCCLLASIAGIALGQTPPIQPQTPDVKVPPPLVLPPPAQVAIGKEPLGVAEAVALALRNQPLINIAQGNLLTAEGRLRAAQSDLFPTISGNAAYSHTITLRGSSGSGSSGGGGTTGSGGGSTNSFTAAINVDQLLFDFGRTRDTVRQQSALERAERQALARTLQTVTLSVKQAFYNLVQQRQLVAISEENLANRQRQLDEAQARLTSGLGAPSDLVNAKSSFADATLSLITARSDALSAQISLNEALGIDPRTPITPASGSEAPIPDETDLTSLVQTAMEQRPDIKEARERVSAAQFAVSAAKKNDLPRFSASAGIGGRGPNDPLQTQTLNFGVQVQWSFNTGGLTTGLVQEARGSEQVARAQLIQTSQTALSDVSQAYLDLQVAEQRLDTAAVQLANAREFVRIAEGRYSGGIGTFLEVTTAQSGLFTALRNVAQAQPDVERARARLRAALGVS